jgi:hypothetical protein
MTKDEILSMAKESGFMRLTAFVNGQRDWWECFDEEIERFAALVAEKATEQANARQNASWALMCEKMVAAEREACAKLAEQTPKIRAYGESMAVQDYIANAIRARSQKEYRGARLVLTKDGVIQDGWMGDK